MASTAVSEQQAELHVSNGGLTVQQVSELTGLSEHTLRYYEKIKLLSPVQRDVSSKHRRYTSEDLAKIETLACLRAVGMPIEQMRNYFELAKNGKDAAAELKAILETQRAVLRERIAQMQKNLDYVDYKITFWSEIEAGNEEKAMEFARDFQRKIRGKVGNCKI